MPEKKDSRRKHSIAIIGMGCIFPKSSNLKEYWSLLSNGIDAIQEIPDDTHWKLKDYFDKDPSTPDHTYCKRGGFLPKVTFDPLSYGIPPNNLQATDTSQLLGLEVAKMALEDAGYSLNSPILQEKKVNVILGVTGTQELVIPLGARLGHPIWEKALEDAGIEKNKREEIIQRIQEDYVPWQENSFPGLLGNVVAGRIANRLNLSGTNTVADAACASSLSALHTAVMELTAKKCDMSITGGVDTLNDIFMHMCFSKTGVLSHSSDAKPFSKDADGTVLGEGIGMLVLKRFEDAKKDGDKIYALIKGVGSSSDGRTSAIYAPDSDGQLKALKEAYNEADIDPSTVELIEAHGTGTRVGDKVEFNALKKCFEASSRKNQTAIGSVKSMIGHTKAAAGAAGIIKSALCLYHKVLPPTLKAQEPDPELDINNSSFYLNSESKPWIPSPFSKSRRSGVSAFGFGGSNFHAVLEEYDPLKSHISWDGRVQIIAFSADAKDLLYEKIQAFKTRFNDIDDPQEERQMIAWLSHESRQSFSVKNKVRLLMVHREEDSLEKRLETALECIKDGASSTGVYFSSGSAKGKIGYLFPGQGSQYAGMGKDLLSTFPEAIKLLETASGIFSSGNARTDKLLQDYIYPPPTHLQSKKVSEGELRNTDIAQPSIGVVSIAMAAILDRFGVRPDITCGHSFGELSALCSAGWLDKDSFFQLATARGKFMSAAKSGNGDSGSMLAVQGGLQDIENLITESSLDLILANKNSKTQGVLSGPTDEILRAQKLCKQKKLRAVKLPVAAAFHSKLVKNAAAPFKNELNNVNFSPSEIDVLSNTTGTPYNTKASHVKNVLGNQLAHPVNFVDNIEYMFKNKVSAFIEVGPKNVLTGLTRSILKGKDFTAISLDASSGKKSGIEDLAHTLCMIASKGFCIDLTPWEDKPQKPTPKKMKVQLSGANPKPEKSGTISRNKQNPAVRPKDKGFEITSEKEDYADLEKQQNNLDNVHSLTALNENRSSVKGSDMTAQNTPEKNTMNTAAYEAMKMVQKGLEAMQQIQTQTAKAHEKFLETQAQASRTLAGMLEQTRNLAMDNPASAPAVPATADTTYIPPVQEKDTHSNMSKTELTSSLESAPVIEKKQAQEQNEPVKVDTGEPQNDIEPVLFEIVSKLTGFPVEMLESDMDIESDLGIDSIKKVEIISELEKQIPSCEGLTTDNIGSVRTLKDICVTIQDETGHTVEKGNKTELSDKPVYKEETNPNYNQIVSGVLVDTISELTGFPVEMLEPSMNLESDLGIDSIKRVEILSKLEQELDHIDTISSDDIANLKTIEEIVSYLTKTQAPDPLEVKKKTSASEVTAAAPAEPPRSDQKLTRQVVSLEEYPTNQIRFYNGSKIELPAKKKIYITKDSAGIASQFKKEFQHIGINAELINLARGTVPELPDAGGIVIIPDSFTKTNQKKSRKFLASAFELVKNNEPFLVASGIEKGAFLATISFLGGGFGFYNKGFHSDPVYGGLAGLAKTADIELKEVLCRALDLPDSPDECLINAEAAVALMMTHGSVEMGLDGDSCNIPTLIDQDITEAAPELSKDDVIVITGGAKGVTAACAVELSKQHAPTIILIGRSKQPSPDPDWAENIFDEAELKRAILTHKYSNKVTKPAKIQKAYQEIISNREIKKNISQMENFGSRVRYFSADIRNKKEIQSVFKKVKKEFKHVTAIIHGAGILKDKLIVDKKTDQFCQVLETKVNGLDALLSASGKEPLKYVVLFSSIAARTGNQGQCDYAVANEILNKTAQKLSIERTDCKYLSINWGPWEGGMVDASLKKEFHNRGIDLIPLKQGARQLIREMGNADNQNPEIIIGAHLAEKKKPKNPKLSKVSTLSFGVSSTPVLSSHKIDGNPVVPFALLMECHAHAAEKNNPGLSFAGIDNMRLLKGIKPDGDEQSIHINLGKCNPNKNGFEIPSSITSDNGDAAPFIHSTCTLILKDRLAKPPVLSRAAFMELKPYGKTAAQAYDTILFHGRALQGIKSINGYSKKGIEVVTCLAPLPDQWFKNPLQSKWVIEPMMLDAAFQSAILWTYEKKGQVCLPSFIANLRLYSSFKNLHGNIRILFTVNEETKNKIKGYFTFLNEDNTVVASITGFEAITDPSLNKKFKPSALFDRKAILSFAEGSPSEAFGDNYKIFDKDREIARLPRPPYFFMDRVLTADHSQWEMKPGGWIEAQYDVPENGWYFKANRTQTLPFCILLEIALQPCGWLAAYAGSALQSNDRLHFRNLGGKATFIKSLSDTSGTITVRTRMTDVSKAGGMIIQDFDMQVLNDNQMVYQGTTNFGFFTKLALSNQVGIRNSKFAGYSLPEQSQKDVISFQFNDAAPLTPHDKNNGEDTGMPSKALRMIDSIEALSFDLGLYKKGYVKAVKHVDPSEWFFDAHFYQDPVCPGSLGIESFLQMVRFYLLQKYDINPDSYEAQMLSDQTHEWTYRGQIIPSNNKIEIHAHIKNTDQINDDYAITADGALMVDGICIYEMNDFSVGFKKRADLKPSANHKKISEKK